MAYNADAGYCVLDFSIDNLLNQYYRPYAIPGSSTDGTTQNDVLWSSPGPGRVYKAGLKFTSAEREPRPTRR